MRPCLQRGINLGEELAVAGAAVAADNADSQYAGWAARATGLAEQFILEDDVKSEHFQAMHIRTYAEQHGLPSAPDGRAWGHIMRRLKNKGVIEPVGTAKSADPKQHNGFTTEWRAAA